MNDIKSKFTEVLKITLQEQNFQFDESTFESKIWFNLRKKSPSLRLTDEGLSYVIQADLRTYEVDFPKELKISPQILIWLDRYLESPYHLSNNKIIVITEKSAIELHLFSGDLKKYGLTKTINKKISQNLV
jgi:hypothetical protein